MNANIQELAQTLFEEAGDALFLFKPENGRVVEVNPMAQILSCMSRPALLEETVDALFRSEVAGGISRLRRAYQNTMSFHSQDGFYLRQRTKGGWVPVNLTVARLHVKPKTLGLITARDVSERRRTETALRDSETLKRSILESALDGIITMDHQGTIIEFNPAAERVFGFSREKAVGQRLAQLIIPAASREAYARGMTHYLNTGEGTILDKRIEVIALRADGSEFPVELTVTAIRIKDNPVFTAFVRDVTERRQLEEQFRQAQKMEAVGQLAGGVAHDFNNLLTVINGYCDLLLKSIQPDDPCRESLEEIHKAGERSVGLTRQLLAFSRRQVLAPRTLNMNAVMANTEKMLRRTIGEDVALTMALDPNLGSVQADPGQIEQILLNLAVNARDAMPTGGRLTIETRNVELNDDYDASHPNSPTGPHVLLKVTDTGCGMSPEAKARIFEPFFTTKGPGKGTGLGLATVYGIVHQSGGHIDVETEVGVGTTFNIYLPRDDMPVATKKTLSTLRPPPRGSETVLLVEDEDGVRALTRCVLTGCGYSVLEAVEGDEAVRVAAGHSEPIHLLISDVVMPGAGGRVVADRVTELHPEAHVLFVSGYTDDAVVRHGVSQQEVNFLQKPFSPFALAHKVREVLDSPA
jgi:two-component system cell cycle sensor histidine kinase/response regulator CckA